MAIRQNAGDIEEEIDADDDEVDIRNDSGEMICFVVVERRTTKVVSLDRGDRE